MQEIEKHLCFGGTLSLYEHNSDVLGCVMKFSLFMPPQAQYRAVPFVTYLSGLTCTHENFTTKAGAYKFAAHQGLAIVAPDTSPRGSHVPDDEHYDFGQGAGFYLNATQEPWSKHYHMESYIIDELNVLVCDHYALVRERQGILGHSMGGHGALTLGLKYPDLFTSISAFAPIVAPSKVPWGQKAFMRYLGDDKDKWKQYDACALMLAAGNRSSYPHILIDQGGADDFLETQLKPHLFADACAQVGQSLTLRMHGGYDHSYYFIQTYIEQHINHHTVILKS